MKDVLIGVAVAVGVVVLYKMFLAPPSGPTSGANQPVDPTLAGVAGIVGAAGGLIDSIGGLISSTKDDTKKGDAELEHEDRSAQLGRWTIDGPPIIGTPRNETIFGAGFAVVG